MASIQSFGEYNGAQGGTPTRGLTATTGISNCNWKSIDDVNTAYTSYPVTGGTNSYDKFNWLIWTGSYNQLLNGRWQHVSGVLGAGLSLFVTVSGSGFYTTPTQNSNANLVRDLTSTGLSSTGLVVPFLTTGAFNNDYSLTSTGAVAYSPLLISQMRTTVAAAPGDSASVSFAMTWDEN